MNELLHTTQEINDIIKASKGLIDENKISDGYHTFGELYKHRIHLFIALLNIIYEHMMCKERYLAKLGAEYQKEFQIIKSKKHFDGSSFDGWFIVQLDSMQGQISYHLPNEYWEELEFIPTLPNANKWDGHTSDDVLKRLLKLTF